MIEQLCVHKTSGKTFRIVGEQDNTILLECEGRIKPIAISTFKRYYQTLTITNNKVKVDKEVQIQQAPKKQYQYYKNYCRNLMPLWNGTIGDKCLNIKDQEGNIIIQCTMSETKKCIKVKQVKTGARRYFPKFEQAKRHIVYDQDIKTTEYLSKLFDKWLKQQMEAN